MHVVVCVIVMFLRKYDLFNASYARYGALGVTLFAWFIFAILTALGTRMTKVKSALLYSFLAVVPIIIIVTLCFALSMFEGLDWLKFFFIGSTVNFYFRPFVTLFGYINISAYLFYGVCIVLLVLFSFAGGIIGINTDKKKDRSKKKKEQKKNIKSEDSVKVKSKKSVNPTKKNLEKMSEDARLIEDTSKEVEMATEAVAKGAVEQNDKQKVKKEKVLGENISVESDKQLQEEIERLKKKLEERKKQNASD